MGDQRVELHRSEEIPASADEVWALLTDWAGMMRWSLSAKREGALGSLVRCELIGEADKVPRTRRMILSSGAAVEEELFYQNDETRRIYYRKTDGFGTRGYLASSYVDELADRRSRLHILSWFDAEQEAAVAAARYDAIYAGHIRRLQGLLRDSDMTLAVDHIYAETQFSGQRKGARKILVIACGALAREVLALRLDAIDVACLPAQLHNHPKRIPDAMRAKIRASREVLRRDPLPLRRLRHRRRARSCA